MTKDGLIGKNNSLPWHIQEELNFFLKTTQFHSILLGRKTFEGLPKTVLQDRNVIILTKDHHFTLSNPSLTVTNHLSSVLDKFNHVPDQLFICGGKIVYEQTYQFADKIYLSIINQHYDGDVYLNLDLLNNVLTNNFTLTETLHFNDFKVLIYCKI